MCGNRIALTTNCSGMGTPEVALGMLCAWLKTQEVPDIIAHSYSASDVDPLCQQMLLAHGASFGPQHVFGDMLHQLPAQWVEAWRCQLQYFRDIISKHIDGRRATHGFRKADRVDLIDGYGTRFLRSLRWFVTTRKADCDYSNMCWVGAVRWHGATVWSPAPGPVPGPPRGLPPTVLLGGLLLSGLLLSGRLVAEFVS